MPRVDEGPRTIGIVGSRRRNTRTDYNVLINKFLDIYQSGDRLVSGGCPKGADAFAEEIAKRNGLTITIHFPKWQDSRFAGLERNTLIAQDCDILIALPAEDRKGGTEDTIRKAQELGKEVILI